MSYAIYPCPPGLEKYPGNKSQPGVYHSIINYLPPHSVYVEPFVGSGVIFRYKKPAAFNYINDIDFDVMQKWRDDCYMKNYAGINLNISNHSAINAIEEVCNKKIYKGTFEYLIKDVLIYCDVPYLLETRRSMNPIYQYEMTRKCHIRFLKYIIEVKCNVMISHYPCKLYDEMLSGWTKLTFPTMTHRGKVIEAIYFNYPIPDKLHDYRYFGINFTDRQRVNRKINRWVSRLKSLPIVERNAIIEKIYTFGI